MSLLCTVNTLPNVSLDSLSFPLQSGVVKGHGNLKQALDEQDKLVKYVEGQFFGFFSFVSVLSLVVSDTAYKGNCSVN